MEAKTWTKEEIEKHVNQSTHWIERGVLALYKRQTKEEKDIQGTVEDNHKGLSAAHAKIGSYLAKWLLMGNHLTGRFVEKGRKICIYHIKQLTAIANKKGA